jgi:hypothetical protein
MHPGLLVLSAAALAAVILSPLPSAALAEMPAGLFVGAATE